MNSEIIFDLLLDSKNEFDILKDLSEEEVSFLKDTVSSVKKNLLFPFEFHGIHHSQKVFLFGHLISKQVDLSSDEKRILYDALLLHDCGRENEIEDDFHGFVSARKLKKVFEKDPFYLKEPNLKLLMAIVDAHSTVDERAEVIVENYSLESYSDRFFLLLKILKDADALDRARFPKETPEFIKEDRLRMNYSKKLIELSYAVNAFYVKKLNDMKFDFYLNEYLSSKKENDCMHAIGFDFYKLEGILDYGILSSRAAMQSGILLSRNFKGNNSDMWISVVSGEDISKRGSAYEKFLMNGICIYALAGKFQEGELISSKANSLSLPKKSNEYNDESFVFYNIPPEDIMAIVVPGDYFGMGLGNLDYYSCATNFRIVKNRTDSYIEYIKKTTGLDINTDIINEKIDKLMNTEIDFGKKSAYDQRSELSIFINSVDEIVKEINLEMCKWMDYAFRIYFNLGENECPTVGMLVEDILQKKNIEHKVYIGNSDDGTTIYVKNLKNKLSNSK